MATIAEALAIAWQHEKQGRRDLAEQVCRQILQVEPNHADAIHLLGILACHAGQHAAAVDWLSRAVGLNPSNGSYHSNLGEVYRALGRLDEAVDCYRRAIALHPLFAAPHNNLGLARQSQGRLDEAIACFHQALALRPDFAAAHYNLGTALRDQGKTDEAVACFRRALALQPDSAAAHHNLGCALRDQGKTDEAIACFRRALALQPDSAAAHHNLGCALRKQGKTGEAIACFRRALALRPEAAETHHNLGCALKEHEETDEAIACFRRALALQPDSAAAHHNLGFALRDQGKTDEAIACFRRALALQPDLAEAHHNLGFAFKQQGKTDEAIACFRRVAELRLNSVGRPVHPYTNDQWAEIMRLVLAGHAPDAATAVDSSFREAEAFKRAGIVQPGYRVLDLGSGNGRQAIGLTGCELAEYVGVEPVLECVVFCDTVFAPYPNFRFMRIDLRNDLYNPRGTVDPLELRLPFEDEHFDAVLCGSLFTHLGTEVVCRHYLDEICRVLAPAGRFCSTWFRSPPNKEHAGHERTVFPEPLITEMLSRRFTPYQSEGGLTDDFHDQWRIFAVKN